MKVALRVCLTVTLFLGTVSVYAQIDNCDPYCSPDFDTGGGGGGGGNTCKTCYGSSNGTYCGILQGMTRAEVEAECISRDGDVYAYGEQKGVKTKEATAAIVVALRAKFKEVVGRELSPGATPVLPLPRPLPQRKTAIALADLVNN